MSYELNADTYLPILDAVARIQSEFADAKFDALEGQRQAAAIVARLRGYLPNPPMPKEELLADIALLEARAPEATAVTIPGISHSAAVSFLLMPNTKIFVDFDGPQKDALGQPVLRRLANALGYRLQLV